MSKKTGMLDAAKNATDDDVSPFYLTPLDLVRWLQVFQPFVCAENDKDRCDVTTVDT